MKSSTDSPGVRLGLLTLAAIPALLSVTGHALPGKEDAGLLLVPFVPGEVRVLRSVEVGLLVYNPDPDGATVWIESAEVIADGEVIFEEALDFELVGDSRYGELNALVERMPLEITELHRDRRYFAPEDAPEFIGNEVNEARREIAVRWDRLAGEYDSGCPIPFRQWNFVLHTDQLFFADAPAGTRCEVALRVRYRDASRVSRVASVRKTITRLAAPLAAPGTYAHRRSSVTRSIACDADRGAAPSQSVRGARK